MAGRIAGLYVDLIARTEKFNSGLNGATKGISSFASKATDAFAKIGLAWQGVSSIVGAISAPLANAAERFKEIGKTADKIGISTDALQKLEYAARQTGANVDNLREGLVEMTLRLGEAATTGGGTMNDALKKMNLNINELIGLKPEQQFFKIIDAVNKLPKEERIFNLDEMFGGDVNEFMQMTALGSTRIKELGEEAVGLGQVASQGKIEGMQRAAKAIELMNISIQNLVGSLAQLAETTGLNSFLAQFSELISDAERFYRTGTKATPDFFVGGVEAERQFQERRRQQAARERTTSESNQKRFAELHKRHIEIAKREGTDLATMTAMQSISSMYWKQKPVRDFMSQAMKQTKDVLYGIGKTALGIAPSIYGFIGSMGEGPDTAKPSFTELGRNDIIFGAALAANPEQQQVNLLTQIADNTRPLRLGMGLQ